MTTLKDDRTADQHKTHTLIVMASDSFMSGWGGAKGGTSYAGWACKPEDVDAVERYVTNRSDMKRVRIVSGDYRPSGRHCAHCHIYVASANNMA